MSTVTEKHISILGCGWLGKPLASHLIQAGYTVKGSTRSAEKASQLARLNIAPFIVNINDHSISLNEFLNSHILIVAITSKEISDYAYLFKALETSPIKKAIFISSTSVYRSTNTVVTEADPDVLSSSPLLPIENLFRSCKTISATIVRFAGLYGYTRKPGNFFSSGKQVPGPDTPVNMIHGDDCIAILHEIIKQNAWNETFNACADTHPTKREFYTHAALVMGNKIPDFSASGNTDYKIISNKKVKERLRYQFKHNDLMDLTEENE